MALCRLFDGLYRVVNEVESGRRAGFHARKLRGPPSRSTFEDKGLHGQALGGRRRRSATQIPQPVPMAMLSVRGIGVAVRVSTSTSVRSALSFSLSRTPKRCSSSMTTRPKSLNRVFPCSNRCVAIHDVDGCRRRRRRGFPRPPCCCGSGTGSCGCGPANRPKRSTKGRVVLLGEEGGRHQHGDLFAGLDGDENAAQGDLGLAEADVAADRPVHGLAGLEVAQYLFDRGAAPGRRFPRTGRPAWNARYSASPAVICVPCRAARREYRSSNSCGDVAYALGGLAAAPSATLLAAELVQRRGFRRRAGVPRDQVQSLHGDVQLARRPHTRAPETRRCSRRHPWS